MNARLSIDSLPRNYKGHANDVTDQPQDRQGPWPHHPAVAAAARGSGHRVTRGARHSVTLPTLVRGSAAYAVAIDPSTTDAEASVPRSALGRIDTAVRDARPA